MKRIILSLLMLTVIGAYAQMPQRLSFDTNIGTGISLNRPAYTPLVWQVMGDYHFNQRISLGMGTGLSLYEKPLLPLFAQTRFNLCKPRRFTPYLNGGFGYGFVLADKAHGGICWHLMAGVQYKRVSLSVGFEHQKLERLKRYEGDILSAEYVEKLSHPMVAVKIGFEFVSLH